MAVSVVVETCGYLGAQGQIEVESVLVSDISVDMGSE